jgi:hypothetical protein
LSFHHLIFPPHPLVFPPRPLFIQAVGHPAVLKV